MNKHIIVVIILLIVLTLLILIFSCVSSRNNTSNQIYNEVDLDYFGSDLLKELDHKSEEGEIEIANQVLTYAREVANGKITNDSKIYKHYSPYSYNGCESVDLQVELITCIVNGKEGHLWVKTSYNKYDDKGEVISYGSVPLSLWKIKKVNGVWKVEDVNEPV